MSNTNQVDKNQAPKLKYVHRYVYALVDKFGVITFADTRRHARLLKSDMGGSPKVKIVQFKASEIVR